MALSRLPRLSTPPSTPPSEPATVPVAPSPSAPLPPSEPAAVVTPPSPRPPVPSRDGLVGELIAPAVAAARLSVTAKVLQRWRATGVGPAFVMLTSKTIRYRPEDLDAFIADRMRAGTSTP